MKKLIGLVLLSVSLVVFAACGSSEAAEKGKIVVGSQGSDADVWKFIAKSDAAKEAGLTIEVQEIDGGPQLNNATSEGEVDVNAFQSLGYLKSYNNDGGGELAPIGTTYMEPLGVYSSKVDKIEDVKENSVVALADNPANTARGLKLLEAAGLIKLKDDFDSGTGTPSDVVENPKNLEFTLIDDTTGPRVLPDVDLVLISNTVALEGGLNVLKDAIYYEKVNEDTEDSINVLATKKSRADDAELLKLVDLYHSKEVQDYVEKTFEGTKVEVKQDIASIFK
ncbi:metal ABC transporter substrate-binding protein [Enterococcus sp. JM4C]|uniref:MetQ/NlpA family ABC transporter substrate-binding protein n=1 Tax=Candidatus Enterococcus huntleyi TaxID=1857217 RepID=UPI001379B09F|nr:MetQ/NlpA family ABC transporter substrate-binding protein [Enterococcus sp. JM4C]KAF1295562.1 metal ABC transporter substrate-binding protein [Enterococcus sp. JM4C]